MNDDPAALYDVIVVHRRLRPVEHDQRYALPDALVDVARLDELDRAARLFSYNRFNLFSIRDRDHGPGDGTPLAEHVARLTDAAGLAGEVTRVELLCLPRMLGYVFNPLSVYFCYGRGGEVRLILYEVSNTFGERKTYVVPASPGQDGAIRQAAGKRLYVSPFNHPDGRYDFTIAPPGERVRVGVALSRERQAVLSAHLVGRRRPFDDHGLARTFARHPALTWKVIGGIHWEALKLWRKGLRPVPRPRDTGQPAIFAVPEPDRPLQ